MGIAAIANDYLTRPLRSAAGTNPMPYIPIFMTVVIRIIFRLIN